MKRHRSHQEDEPTMPEFAYTDLLPLGPDATDYRLLTADGMTRRQALRPGLPRS